MAKTKIHGEYLDPSVISGQTQVTAVGADSMLIFDATDNALKKALLSDLIETVGSTPTFSSVVVDNFTLDGTTLALSGSADMTLDSGGRIILSADDNGEIRLQDGSSIFGQFKDDDDRLSIQGKIADKDMMFTVIDDSSEITALKFDASDAGKAIFNAGANFGTTSSSTYAVQIQANTGGNALQLKGRNAAENAGWLVWTDFSGNAEAGIYATADNLIFANTTSYTERMRILPNGTLLVGKTADNNTVGFKTNTSSSYMVSSGETPFFINRLSDDGNLIEFRKDSSAVGSIGSEGGDALFIQGGTTSGSGLVFHPSSAFIAPARNGAKIDATNDSVSYTHLTLPTKRIV